MPHPSFASDYVGELADLLASDCVIDAQVKELGARVLLHLSSEDFSLVPQGDLPCWVAKTEPGMDGETIVGRPEKSDGPDNDQVCVVVQDLHQIKFVVQKALPYLNENEEVDYLEYDFFFHPDGTSVIFTNEFEEDIKITHLTSCGQTETHLAAGQMYTFQSGCYEIDIGDCQMYVRLLGQTPFEVLEWEDVDESDTEDRASYFADAITASDTDVGSKGKGKRPLSALRDTAIARPIVRRQRIRRLDDAAIARSNGALQLKQLKDNETIMVHSTFLQAGYRMTRRENLALNKDLSQVLLASNPVDNSVYVHKTIIWSGRPKTAENWLNEFSIHSKLHHRSIAEVLFGDARILSIHMEFIDGVALSCKSLRDNTGHCTMPMEQAKRVMEDIAGALDYCHSKGIVHNDIKASNILWHAVRGGVLIDFGLAGFARDLPNDNGSPWYIAYEFMGRKAGERGPRGRPGDMWALGVVLLFLYRRIMLPDMTESWNIWHITRGVATAVYTMRRWITYVRRARAALLNVERSEYRLVVGLLADERPRRLTARQLVAQLPPRDEAPLHGGEQISLSSADTVRAGGAVALFKNRPNPVASRRLMVYPPADIQSCCASCRDCSRCSPHPLVPDPNDRRDCCDECYKCQGDYDPDATQVMPSEAEARLIAEGGIVRASQAEPLAEPVLDSRLQFLLVEPEGSTTQRDSEASTIPDTTQQQANIDAGYKRVQSQLAQERERKSRAHRDLDNSHDTLLSDFEAGAARWKQYQQHHLMLLPNTPTGAAHSDHFSLSERERVAVNTHERSEQQKVLAAARIVEEQPSDDDGSETQKAAPPAKSTRTAAAQQKLKKEKVTEPQAEGRVLRSAMREKK